VIRLEVDAIVIETPREALIVASALNRLADECRRAGQVVPELPDLVREFTALAGRGETDRRNNETPSDRASESREVSDVDAGGFEPVRLMRVGAAADLLGCSEQYTRRLARDGFLQGSQKGEDGAWLLDAAAVEAFRLHVKQENDMHPTDTKADQ